jgi:hypothetical protein
MRSICTKTTMHRSALIQLLGFKAKKQIFSYKPFPHDLLYVVVRQRSSGGVHTFKDRKRESRPHMNIVDGDNQSRHQGRVVVQVDKDKHHKSSASEGLHMYGV